MLLHAMVALVRPQGKRDTIIVSGRNGDTTEIQSAGNPPA